jgi:Protein of unknown function (DUF1549)/Protein of unknown function (DUF1553)/Bacterial Ig-like domain/Bacterial Ig-like domain (group 2)
MKQHWGSKTNGKGIAHLAKMVILLAASLGALSWIMPGTGAATGRRPPSEHNATLVRVVLEPSNPLIFGAHLTQTLIVTGKYTDGSLRDLTRQASFTSSDPAVATVDPSGTVKAIKNGMAWITAKVGRLSARQAIRVQLADQKRAISFVNDIAPIFARLGCSNSNCHGALNGQNGFKLSLFGYEPETDYKAVVEASEGRRINLAEPAKSLILLKPTQSVSHGGGKRFGLGSPEYNALKEWIEAGAPAGSSKESKMVRLEVIPRERVLLSADAMQQLVVLAHYVDGTTADVTRRVRYQSNDDSIATVSADGLVAAKRSGEAAILVRSLDQVTAASIGVVLSPPVRSYPSVPRHNFIDELVFSKLKRLNIVPSDLSTDEEFLRRAHLDLIGVLPTAEEARKFLASRAPNKRVQLVDELLERPEYADFWGLYWSDRLSNSRQFLYEKGTFFFQQWLREAMEQNLPYDQFARDLITATGGLYEVAPTSYYPLMKKAEEMATTTSQVFLGVSLECARCHDHPFEKWKQDDFLGLAAFFAQVRHKNRIRQNERVLYLDPKRELTHPKHKQPVVPKFLGGQPVKVEPGRDRREVLADWMTAPSNPFFAKAIVNRLWKHFMGRGLVDPVDDFRVTNPPTNEALLAALAEDFIRHKYDLKHLFRAIVGSRVYQLSAQPNGTNKEEKQFYSRFYLKRLNAEELLDGICRVTEVPEKFPGFHLGLRATQLPDPKVPSYFLDVFDRATRETVCERKQTTSVMQVMHLVSGDTINQKIRAENGLIERLIKSGKSSGEIIEELYLSTLSRFPKKDEAQLAQQGVSQARSPREGYEDLLWALLNSKEFLFNH